MPDLPEPVRSLGPSSLGRGGFLSGALAVRAGAALATCTSTIPPPAAARAPATGGAGSTNAMRAIHADNTVLTATVTDPPTMAGSAVSLARPVAQGQSDLVEQGVPASITLGSATVTRDNVGPYLPLGLES